MRAIKKLKSHGKSLSGSERSEAFVLKTEISSSDGARGGRNPGDTWRPEGGGPNVPWRRGDVGVGGGPVQLTYARRRVCTASR